MSHHRGGGGRGYNNNNHHHHHHHNTQHNQQQQGHGVVVGGRDSSSTQQRETIVRDKIIRLCDMELVSPSYERVQVRREQKHTHTHTHLFFSLSSSSSSLSHKGGPLPKELASFLLRGTLDIGLAKTVVDCANVQALKLPIYAALTAVLNAKMAAFGEWVVQLCFDNLALGMEPNMLRFVAELRHVGVLGEMSLQNLFGRLQVASRADPRLEELLALSLPWAASVLNPQALEEWVEAIPEERPLSQYLRDQLVALRKNDWHCESSITRISFNWKSLSARVHEHELSASQGIVLGKVPHLTMFRCFAPQDSEQGLLGCDRLVTECYVLDISQFFAPTLPLAVDRLLTMMPLKFRYDWIMVETLIGQMIHGATEPLFSHALLSNLMRTQVKLAGLYFRAVDSMFQGIADMGPDARQRFVDWFAVHLSNFAFKWDWSEWVTASQGLPDDHPKILFLRALLGRLVRLSYWARVEKSLPPPLQEYMPPYPKPSAVTVDETDGDAAVQQLLLTVLSEATTFSLLKAGLVRHGKELRELAKSDDAKLKLLRVLGLYWAHSEGQRLMVADQLLTALVVDQMAIVSWIFSEHSAGSLISYAPWEILHMAVKKTVDRTAFIRQQPQTDVVATKLEKQLREEKDLFLTIFQKFAIVLEAYLEENRGQENSWFRAVLGQMESFVRRYSTTIQPIYGTLESFVFSDDCDSRIREAYQRAKAI